MKRYAVIVAGGKGSRMQSELPKQFMLLQGKPILMRTISCFREAIEDISIILVLPKIQIDFWNALCVEHDFALEHQIVEGGETRFNSVKNGLAVCMQDGLVGIHDGVRPLISADLIQRCYDSAENYGSGLPVVQITQSLRKVSGQNNSALSREGIVAVQTPQCFQLAPLKKAFEANYHDSFTDDATVFEFAGNNISLVKGEETNLKITTPADLRIAEAIIAGILPN